LKKDPQREAALPPANALEMNQDPSERPGATHEAHVTEEEKTEMQIEYRKEPNLGERPQVVEVKKGP